MASPIPIIEAKNVSKVFRLAHEPQRSVKSVLINLFKRRYYEQFKALDNVNFCIAPGEFVSIIGPNGCGKSTLLKIIAGIYDPTSGSLKVGGGISPFLELGVGFDNDLTARENEFLYGSILGLTRAEIKDKFSEIVEFSELARFMDTPLRNFSSGMNVRLAFATAIQSDAPVMLFDEVLAVGDGGFQEKCFKYFENVKKRGRTIIFVSHSMDSVVRFSDRVILMDKGKKIMEGPAEVVTSAYNTLVGSTEPAVAT